MNRVRYALVCGRTDRNRLLGRCEELIGSFRQENPEAGYAELVRAFGEPAAFAGEALAGLEESSLESARKRRLWLRRAVIAAAVAVVIVSVFAAAFWYMKYRRQLEFDDGYIWVVGPATEITEEEYYEGKARVQ